MLYAVIARWADRQNLSSLSPTLSSRQPLNQSARKPRHPQPFPLFRNLTMSARVTKHAGSTHSAHCVGGKVEDQLSIKTKKFKRFENWTLTQRSFLAPSRLLWRREGEVDHPHQQHRQQHHHYLASWAKVDHADIIIMFITLVIRRQIVRMLGTVVIFFFACLLPFKVAFFLISPHVDQEFVFYILFRRVKNKESTTFL